MMLIRMLSIPAMALALLLGMGCKSKGPVPSEEPASSEAAKVGSTETGGAHPAVGTQDPHAGVVPPPSPHGTGTFGQPDESGVIDVGAIAFEMPDNWQAEAPRSSMRRAQLSAPGSAGPAELIVYYFGEQGAGSAQANIERWIGQFSNADGSAISDPEQSSSQVAGLDVTKVEVAGQYSGGMGPAGQAQPTQADQRLIAAIVETPGGPYYLKLLGPDATVKENTAAFDALLGSIVTSP